MWWGSIVFAVLVVIHVGAVVWGIAVSGPWRRRTGIVGWACGIMGRVSGGSWLNFIATGIAKYISIVNSTATLGAKHDKPPLLDYIIVCYPRKLYSSRNTSCKASYLLIKSSLRFKPVASFDDTRKGFHAWLVK